MQVEMQEVELPEVAVVAEGMVREVVVWEVRRSHCVCVLTNSC